MCPQAQRYHLGAQTATLWRPVSTEGRELGVTSPPLNELTARSETKLLFPNFMARKEKDRSWGYEAKTRQS